MAETHDQAATDTDHDVAASTRSLGPRLTTIRTPRRHTPTTLIASLGILTAMTVGIVSNWSRAQSPTATQSPTGQSTSLAANTTGNDASGRARAAAGRSTARVREGTRLAGRLGQFTKIGDRHSFTLQGSSVQLVVLENLVLDRVSHVLTDTADTLTWSVSGRVTEFRGANFIILDRAVVKRRSVDGQ